MALQDRLGQMAQFASEVQEILDKEVELLEWVKQKDAQGQEVLGATSRTGSAVAPHPAGVRELSAGGWWFCQIVRDNGKVLAKPVAKFSPELFFEAKPVERLYVERTFEREQKKFETEVAGDVIEWTPITREVVVQPSGVLELGEFAQHFPEGLAFANIGRARGEANPLLGVAPSTSRNAYRVENGALRVPRLDKVVAAKEPKSFPAEWNDERKMLIVYLEGVNPTVKL